MNKVCCAIDAQGFVVNKKFEIIELSIKNDFLELHIYFNVFAKLRHICVGDIFTVDYVCKNINGLKLSNTGSTKCAHEFLKQIYKNISSLKKPYVFIKNSQLAAVLKELKIPYIFSQDQLICKNACKWHQISKAKCSKEKVSQLWKILKQSTTV